MNQLILSLICGIFIGGTCGYLGNLMLSKRMALVAGPLGHLALPGIALALIYGFDVSLGAFPFVILGIILIWLFEMRTRLPMEALVAIVFASGVAISFLFLPTEEAETALIGDITKVSLKETLITAALCILIFILIKKIYSKMLLINISEDLAKAEKVDVKKYNLLYLFAIAILVALGVKMVGGLLTAALVAIPASTSRNLSRNLFQYNFLSIFFGALSAILGISLFKLTSLPSGPLIILTSTIFFLISLIFKK
ncbi:metal ABC transporter permease [bacterium]|nr:metal ABC transporter permease [bacterium]